jgi:beta-glucosidase
MNDFTFPGDFYWGVATSSYQIEGAVDADGRGESIWDRFSATPGAIEDGSTGAIACDHYHRHDGYTNRWFLDPLAGRGYPEDMWRYYGRAVPKVAGGDLEIIAKPIDFLGVNYYNRRLAADNPPGKAPQVRTVVDAARPRTLDREIYPQGLYEILLRLKKEYPFPALFVTENGAAVTEEISNGRVEDPQRQSFLQEHVAQAARARAAGVPLRGYFVWSLLDNFEWALGYTLRYGLVRVAYDSQARTPKTSARWYRSLIAAQKRNTVHTR